MGLLNDPPCDGNPPGSGKPGSGNPAIKTLLLPKIQPWSRVPDLRNNGTKSSWEVSRKGSYENGFLPTSHRNMSKAIFSPNISKRNSEKGVTKTTEDVPLPILSPKPIVKKSTASCNARPIVSLISQSDMNDHLEVPNDRVRRESTEVQAAMSRRSSCALQTDNGESFRRHSLLSMVAPETIRGDDETQSGTSGTGLSQDIWPEWERDTSSNDVEEHFVGIIRRASMSVVLPHVNEDTDTVDVGGIEITPGLYLRRRVKHLPQKGVGRIQETEKGVGRIQEMEKTTQQNQHRTLTPYSINGGGQNTPALVPPLYPASYPNMYRRRRCAEHGTNSHGGHRDLLEREPIPVSVSRLVPFDTSLDSPRITMDNMKSSRKYKSSKNSIISSVEITKSEDRENVSQIQVPLSDRQPGIPFRVQDRMGAKKASFKFKRYWDNMRNYINAVRKLKEKVFLNNFVEVFPRKGLY